MSKEIQLPKDEDVAEENEEEVDEDGNPIKKKKPPVIVIPKKDKSGRISSAKDLMLEIDWSPSLANI